MIAIVDTVAGTFAVDLDTGEVEPADEAGAPADDLVLNLPRVVAAAAVGATVVAVVASKPPLLVSHDAGSTWRESGRGLPAGRTVAIAAWDPDTMVFAARNRLYLSNDGGVFWAAIDVELPEIVSVDISA